MSRSISSKFIHLSKLGGDKALTMTMTPWNLAHGQWSKSLAMTIDTLEFAPWSMVKYDIVRSKFVSKRGVV